MTTRISVIVPVYNTGNLLIPCLDSLAAQTMEEIEFLLIDDGSTDGSGGLCDSYAERDSRFRVIHQKNAGVSAARNTGLKAATGEFIGFVDSDDWIAPDMFEQLYTRAVLENCDIVMCDAQTVYADGRTEADTITQLPQSELIEKNCWTPELLMEMAGSAWRCIYRSALIQQYDLQFSMALKFSEDRVFNIYAMGYAEKLYYVKTAYYFRLIHSESAVHRFHADYYEAVQKAAAATQTALDTAWNSEPSYKTAYQKQLVGGALSAINNYFYKTSPLSHKKRKEKMKSLCADESLRNAIRETGFGGIRGKWILNKKIGLLSACAKCLNWKYRR